jgi:hypothetical protein
MGKLEAGLRLAQPSGCSEAVYRVMNACWEATPKDRPACGFAIRLSLIALQTFGSMVSLVRGLLHVAKDVDRMLLICDSLAHQCR